jgi:predicted heme/steroid binding protein
VDGRLRRRVVGLAVAALLLALAGAVFCPSAFATPQFAGETGKDCLFCHVTPGGPLNAQGQAFQAAGYTLAPTTTSSSPGGAGGGTPTSLGPSGSPGAGPASGNLLTLPGWLRDFLVWAHLVAMVAWLGAIIFVHLVQSPRIAGRGIPRGYLNLAWPSIIVLGISGILLTLNDIPSLSTLTDTRWGRILLLKIALYLLLAGVATFVTFFVNPRLKRLAETEAGHPLGAHPHLKEEGKVTFSYEGKVYDVTASKLWKEGRHARRHEAWQDLTAAMAGAPHGLEVLDRYPTIAGGAEQPTPRPVRFFVILAYANLGLVLAVLLVVAIW